MCAGMTALFKESGVVVVEANAPWMWEEGLWPEEAALLGERVVENRRREFTAGRNCARQALSALGYPPTAVCSGPDREPLWPAGVVGSITHCAGYCSAVIGRRSQVASIGIDAEVHAAVTSEIEPHICTQAELRWIDAAPTCDGIHWPTVIFSAKESLYKAWFPLTHRWLGFNDVEVALKPAHGAFSVRLLVPCLDLPAPQAAISGRYVVASGRVHTAVVIPVL